MDKKKIFEAERTLAMLEESGDLFSAIVRLLASRLHAANSADKDTFYKHLREDTDKHIERVNIAQETLFIATCSVCHKEESAVLSKDNPDVTPICAGCRIDIDKTPSKPHNLN